MKISLDWLSDYVQIDKSGEEIAEILSNLGFPTEGIEKIEDDTVIDVEVTSNRGDCLSHIGIARELAAVWGTELKLPEVTFAELDQDTSELAEVSIEDSELCRRYTGRVISGVKAGPTPGWMKKRLEAVGIRSVNNIVDATNYAMMETGQPPHAFDHAKIKGQKIIVRKAVKGERLVSIDGTKCDLDEDMLIITDAKRPVAIAGVMGGLDTEVSESTTTILLEDAQFDPVSVRTTGRRLGIKSEASFRFERHVDIENIEWASRRTAQLIIEAAGGKVARGVADVYPGKHKEQMVSMRMSRLNKLLGIKIDRDTAVNIFDSLGFDPINDGEDPITCKVPSRRHDISREADLIEEVARCYGYEKIPVENKINIEVATVDKHNKLACELRSFLNGCGFYETINVTFVDAKAAELFSDRQGEDISVKDESRKSSNLLRQSLVGSLLSVFKSNYNAGNVPCRIFELSDTFKASSEKEKGKLPCERTKVAMVLDGDLRELRGVIEGLLSIVNKDLVVEMKPVEMCWSQVGAQIFASGEIVGVCGVISSEVEEKFDLTEVNICGAELDFEKLLEMTGGIISVKPLPRFPSITRDLSLVIAENVCWSNILETVSLKAPSELEDIRFVGIYRGKQIANGKKSVTVSLRFRDEDGTLRHEKVDEFEKAIVDELSGKLGAEIRGA